MTAPPVSAITAKLVMREIYERSYGIHDHANPRLSPLKLVAMHTKENVTEFSESYAKHRRFMVLGMAKLTGLSIVEFFNQPREFTELWFRIANDESARKLKDKDKEGENLSDLIK